MFECCWCVAWLDDGLITWLVKLMCLNDSTTYGSRKHRPCEFHWLFHEGQKSNLDTLSVTETEISEEKNVKQVWNNDVRLLPVTWGVSSVLKRGPDSVRYLRVRCKWDSGIISGQYIPPAWQSMWNNITHPPPGTWELHSTNQAAAAALWFSVKRRLA